MYTGAHHKACCRLGKEHGNLLDVLDVRALATADLRCGVRAQGFRAQDFGFRTFGSRREKQSCASDVARLFRSLAGGLRVLLSIIGTLRGWGGGGRGRNFLKKALAH